MASNPLSIAERNLQRLRFPLIAYGLIGGIVLALKPGQFIWYSYHPLFMMLSFVSLTGLAVLHKKIGGVYHTRVHGYLMMAATVFAAFAGYVIYSNKEMSNKPHLLTYHGKIGALVLLGYLGLALVGFFGLSPEWGFVRTNQQIRLVHKLSGRVLILASWVAIMLHVSFNFYADNLLAQAAFGLPLLVFAKFILL